MKSRSIFHPDFIHEPFWWNAWRPTSTGLDRHVPKSSSVVIVGAGYAGLSTALELAKHGIETTVVEAEEPGIGASTRNGGGVSGGVNLGKSLSGRRVQYAPGEQEAILGEAFQAYSLIEQLITEENINCHWQNNGRFIGAWTPQHYIKQELAITALNASAQSGAYMVPRDQMHKEIASGLYFGGQVISRSSTLHPALLFKGMLDACLRRGVKICAQTKVIALNKSASKWEVMTNKGPIATDQVVIATNGYTGDLTPQLKQRVIPIASHIIVTEELPEGLPEVLLPTNRMINDSLRIRSYYRLTPDRKRILFGGRGRFGHASVHSHSEALYQMMIQRLPQLAGTRVTHAWSGNVAFTFDATPHMGEENGVHHIIGCNGSGVAMMSYLGYQTARKIAKISDFRSSLDRPLPGNPLYRGNPWFLPYVGKWFKLLDRVERSRVRE